MEKSKNISLKNSKQFTQNLKKSLENTKKIIEKCPKNNWEIHVGHHVGYLVHLHNGHHVNQQLGWAAGQFSG